MAEVSPEEQRQIDRYNDIINKESREDLAKALGLVGVPFVAELAAFASGSFSPAAMVRQVVAEEHLYSPEMTSSFDFTDEFKKQIVDAFNDVDAAADDVDSLRNFKPLGVLGVATGALGAAAGFLDELSEAYGEDALPNAVRHLANTYGGPLPARLLSEETIQELWKKPDLYESMYEDGTISHGLYQRFKGKTEPKEAPLVASAPTGPPSRPDFAVPSAVARAMMDPYTSGMPSNVAIDQAREAMEGAPFIARAETEAPPSPAPPSDEVFAIDKTLLENVRWE